MESYPSAQESFNNQSDNQSAIAQSATHTIHSAYKRHTVGIRSSTQTAIVHTTSQHTIAIKVQPTHSQHTQQHALSTHLDRQGCRTHPMMRHTSPSFCAHTAECNSHGLRLGAVRIEATMSDANHEAQCQHNLMAQQTWWGTHRY